ncbi:DUF7563 family protein [Natrarchaeobaculum sulfurireducens]
MPNCDNCDEFVTADYVRVFGLNGEVDGCPACMTYREIQQGGGTPPDRDE